MAFNIADYAKNYDVHPETIAFLEAKKRNGTPSSNAAGVEAARDAAVRTATQFSGNVDFTGTEDEIFIEPSSTTDTIPVTIYKPRECKDLKEPPIIVYFHGGGNVTKSRRTNENVCRLLARDSPCIVASVEYRLAPEYMFPANNDDAKRAVEWVSDNKELIGGSSGSKVGVMGDSAGGRLSAVVCHEAYSVIDFAVLVYPKVDFTKTYKSTEEFRYGPTLPKKKSDWYADQYIKEEDRSLPRASVILNKDFSYLPPTLIIVAEHDQLRDGCYEYYEKLNEFGVQVHLELIKGVPHAFWSLPGAFRESCQVAYKLVSDFIRKHSNQRASS